MDGPSVSPKEAKPIAGQRVGLCVIVTVDITLQNLCRGRLEYFTDHGFDVTVVCAPTSMASEIEARGVRLHTAPLVRAIAPWQDLKAIWNLYWFLRRERFDVVEVSTPKAAFIGAFAAKLAGAPCIVHLLRGLAYQGQNRLGGRLLWRAHWLACRLSHRVVSVSESMLEQACCDGTCSRDKIVVLGSGSSNGVDLQRFSPPDPAVGVDVRRRFGIPQSAVVAGFLGRMTRDKGVAELVAAFVSLSERLPDLYLLLVGDYEERDRPHQSVIERISAHPRIKHVGWQADAPQFLSAMDFVVLPSHREGLANVVLEASAMQLPVVTTEAIGCRDVVLDGETGFCVPIGDTGKLEQAMARLASEPIARRRMGEAARRMVERDYDCSVVWSLQEQEFRRLLGALH